MATLQGNALANVFGQLGMFFSPYIVYSVVFHEALPFLILTLGSFVGAAVSGKILSTYDVTMCKSTCGVQVIVSANCSLFQSSFVHDTNNLVEKLICGCYFSCTEF